MHFFYLDASALVKRYTVEPGSATVTSLIDRLLPLRPPRLLVSWMGFLEIAAVLNRHRNDGRLTELLFQQALLRLSDEVAQMRFVPLNDRIAARALALVLRHNLNASDGLYLRQALDWQAVHRIEDDVLTLIACDVRLLRAAQAEGMHALNPETSEPGMVNALLAE
jgi:predicted nucleic acid-binding protein